MVETKECSKCGELRSLNDFHYRNKKKEIKHSQCKYCQRESKRNWSTRNMDKIITNKKNSVKRNKTLFIDYLSDKSCKDCGITDMRVLEFDHLDSTIKFYNVTELVKSSYSWETIVKEINKCDIVCANCHRIRTNERCGAYRINYINIKKDDLDT